MNIKQTEEIDMRRYRKLTLSQTMKLADYIKESHASFSGKTLGLIASEAEAVLGFKVPTFSLSRVAKTIGLPIKKRKKKENAVPVDGHDNKVIHRKIRTLARIQRKIVDELGIKLKPIQDSILTQLCQYDVTGADDEQ